MRKRCRWKSIVYFHFCRQKCNQQHIRESKYQTDYEYRSNEWMLLRRLSKYKFGAVGVRSMLQDTC